MSAQIVLCDGQDIIGVMTQWTHFREGVRIYCHCENSISSRGDCFAPLRGARNDGEFLGSRPKGGEAIPFAQRRLLRVLRTLAMTEYLAVFRLGWALGEIV
jgi:hypothetical protein